MKKHSIELISQYAEAGPLALNVVEVPHLSGFAFILRAGDLLLMDLRDAHNPCCVYRTSLGSLTTAVEEHTFIEESCGLHDTDEDGMFSVAASALLKLRDMGKDNDPMNIDSEMSPVRPTSRHVCSWSWEPGNESNPRMIFCVDSGELFALEVCSDHDGVRVDVSECLYKNLICKVLLWVEGGFLAALVDMGDGMILKVEEGRLIYGSLIQNIAPILDMSVVDFHDEKQAQIFACCGMAPEGSIRIIRSGISVERLLRTAPIYQGITGTWTLKMQVKDAYHSFLVLSFVEQTRVLSVGLSFTDVTDSVGFQPDVCTLACGLIRDCMLVQIYQNAVRLCLPTITAHPKGVSSSSPTCTTWLPDKFNISLGAIGNNFIIVATSSPCLLFLLGVRQLNGDVEVYEMQRIKLENELSCISIPSINFQRKQSIARTNSMDSGYGYNLPPGVDISNTFVIGTHKPSVEVLCFLPGKCLSQLAIGIISLTNSMGTTISGCVPQDVRLVLVDRLYVLSGLRNGMLLRFEWPSDSAISSSESLSQGPNTGSRLVNLDNDLFRAPEQKLSASYTPLGYNNEHVLLQLIAVRRIGITPAFLIPLSDSIDADIIALSDRPWLLQTDRHGLSYTSISFEPSTHATPVCCSECPKGILFVAENSLHLVEMVHSKRLNVQKFHLGGTPTKVLYHSESRLLLVMRTRTELSHDSSLSDICCVDPLSGCILSSFRLQPGETGKCMELVRVGSELVLVVGTSIWTGPAIMPSGEAESTRGRLIVLSLEHTPNSDTASMTFCSKAGSSSQRASPCPEAVGYAVENLSCSSLCSSSDDNSSDGVKLEETEAWHLKLAYSTMWTGMVLAVCPYLDRYFLASAGNAFYVCGFPNDNFQRVRRLAVARTRFMITTLTSHITRIAVGDCRDGVLFFTYHEDARKLEQLYCDPIQRLVADCILMDVDTAVVSDRLGSITVLSSSNQLEDNASPESNLMRCCSFYMGEICMCISKGSFSYKLPADDLLKGFDIANATIGLSNNSIMASTLLGSIFVFIPISREEHRVLEDLQSRLVVHELTAPILGNDHSDFRSRGTSAGLPLILDGDMLAQFLELTSMQQEDVLYGPPDETEKPLPSSKQTFTTNDVVRLLERVHYALN
ncbi:splicing factor 3B subunit 3 isoform X2 [Impatiens glandulifera]|nr:splicing factor 3B subunit 3 isoform X2 [Impatiens glandulifera]